MVVCPCAQEAHLVADPVRYLQSQHLGVELDGLVDIAYRQDQVAQFSRLDFVIVGHGVSFESMCFYSATTWFSIVPMPSMPARITSPAFRKIPRPMPTPVGVPVAIRSPGLSVMMRER